MIMPTASTPIMASSATYPSRKTPAYCGDGWPLWNRTPIRFWYRQSPEPLEPRTWEIQVSKDDPQQDVPGMAYVCLDSRGMLRHL